MNVLVSGSNGAGHRLTGVYSVKDKRRGADVKDE